MKSENEIKEQVDNAFEKLGFSPVYKVSFHCEDDASITVEITYGKIDSVPALRKIANCLIGLDYGIEVGGVEMNKTCSKIIFLPKTSQ